MIHCLENKGGIEDGEIYILMIKSIDMVMLLLDVILG